MSRDHRRLRVFHSAHALVMAIYGQTRDFPRDEWYGLRAQIRRAAVSIARNIVEGNARRGTLEYVHFVNIARGSAAELTYLVTLARELGYVSDAAATSLLRSCDALIPQLETLLQRMEGLARVSGPLRPE